MKIPTFSQNDQEWSDILIGNTDLNVGRYGCYGTALSMMLWNYGHKLNPGQVFQKLNENKAFTSGGLLTYDGVERTFPGLHFYRRAYTVLDESAYYCRITVDKAIEDVITMVRRGMPPILCVDNLYNDNKPDHAVLCYKASEDLSDWRIKDPGGGKDIPFESKYGPVRENLYGYVSIIGMPTSVPEGESRRVASSVWKAAELRRAYRRNEMWKVDTYAREIVDTLL